MCKIIHNIFGWNTAQKVLLNIALDFSPCCCDYHYYAISLKKIWTQVFYRFKSCSRCVWDLRWWESLTMGPSTNPLKQFVGNKAKGRTCAYQGIRNVRFSQNLACFVFLKHPFWDSPFCLITDEFMIIIIKWKILG